MNISTQSISETLKELDASIKNAKMLEARKKAVLEKAELEFEAAEQETYRLQCLRDQVHLNSLGDDIDWGMVFNYKEGETGVSFDYRKQVIANYGIQDTGHYNPITLQHVFCIEFESDSQRELHDKAKSTAFIFSKLVPNPEDANRKCITIHNLINDEGESFELVQVENPERYSILKCRFGKINLINEFDNLMAALAYIQSNSKVALETTTLDALPLENG